MGPSPQRKSGRKSSASTTSSSTKPEQPAPSPPSRPVLEFSHVHAQCSHHRVRAGRADRRHLHGAGEPCAPADRGRSEEHTSELQSQSNLVCRLLLEKKKNKKTR